MDISNSCGFYNSIRVPEVGCQGVAGPGIRGPALSVFIIVLPFKITESKGYSLIKENMEIHVFGCVQGKPQTKFLH